MKRVRHFLLTGVVLGLSAIAVSAQRGDKPKSPPPKGDPPVVNPQPKRPDPTPQPRRPQYAYIDIQLAEMRVNEQYA